VVVVVMLFWWISGEKSRVWGCVVVDLWWRICGVMVDLHGGGDKVVIESNENALAIYVDVSMVVVWWLGVGGSGCWEVRWGYWF
jgi:hypothetical protein